MTPVSPPPARPFGYVPDYIRKLKDRHSKAATVIEKNMGKSLINTKGNLEPKTWALCPRKTMRQGLNSRVGHFCNLFFISAPQAFFGVMALSDHNHRF